MNDTKSRGARKVAVLGPIPRDQIVTYEGERVEKYGCVMYTAVALSALLDAGDTVVPISHVRRQDEGPIKQILGSFPNIDTSGFTSSADRGDVVELRYLDQNRRVERQTSFMSPILPADVDTVLDADVFVCVPITDYEIGQPTLRHIKERSRATVLLDAHGPATTLTRSGERQPRVWADQDVWLPYIDILKMNLDEASSAWLGESAEVPADPPRLSDEQLRDLARHCLDRGVGALCVTLDERGCVAFYRDGSGEVAGEFVHRIEVKHVVDTTGAGDSFAGGLAYGYLAYGDYVVACEYGNAMGAQRCTGTELNVYLSREETERQILAAYGLDRRRSSLEHPGDTFGAVGPPSVTARTAGPTGGAVDGFLLAYDGFDPETEGLREALTSTGNGYLCTRGAAEWEDADGVHYPGTYTHGGYNRETTILGGLPVLNEDLVNLPNWLVLQLRIEGEEAIGFADVELLGYRHELDIRNATVLRHLRFRDRKGRETTLTSRRFVSMADPHHAGIEWTLVPQNWSGHVEVISALDARVRNGGVARYQQLEGRHLNPVSPRTFGPEVIALKAETRQSNLYISQATRTRAFRGGELLPATRTLYQMEDYIQQVLAFDVRQGQATRVEKMVAFYTSRDPAVGDTLVRAARSAARHSDFARSFERHSAAWDELWRTCDGRVSGNEEVQLLLRLHTAHLLQVCSRHTADLDAGLPARGLNGEAYRGHVFWDELYAFPFFNLRLPEVARGLLMYRYRRIGEARAAAREAGFRGAMFPWQSGSEGSEETQRVHLNPLSGRWEPDLSANQRHVNAAIFFNIWNYFQTTYDYEFLERHGAEMMLEITRFWASIAHFNPERERYEIHGVMGPDEFHEKYPGAAHGGLRNNAYTNVMVAWLCDIAGRLPSLLPASSAEGLRARLGIRDEELARWQDMSRRMFVPFGGDGIISQFEGYGDLEELDWDAYRARYGNIQRLDRILRAEGDDPDRYKITKQADTVMLFFLFTGEELRVIFERLGYDYRSDTAARNIAYYDRRTSHGSTLSFVTHAGVLAALDPESSWDRFLVALRSDVDDIQGGTTKEGIHLGVMAGTLDVVQRYYAGAQIRDSVLCFDPRLPSGLGGLSFPMQFLKTPIQVTLSGSRLTLAVHPEGARHPIRAGIPGDVRELCPGDQAVFELSRGGPANGVAAAG